MTDPLTGSFFPPSAMMDLDRVGQRLWSEAIDQYGESNVGCQKYEGPTGAWFYTIEVAGRGTVAGVKLAPTGPKGWELIELRPADGK